MFTIRIMLLSSLSFEMSAAESLEHPNMSHFMLQMSTDFKKRCWEKALMPESKPASTS